MSIESALARFRKRQAAQFTQTADIDRPIGEAEFDPTTGFTTQPVLRIRSGIGCKLTSNARQGEDVQAGETEVRLVDHTIKFDVGIDIEKDDLVTITNSKFNTADIGVQYRVTDVDRREWQISRRCVVEETLVPMMWED